MQSAKTTNVKSWPTGSGEFSVSGLSCGVTFPSLSYITCEVVLDKMNPEIPSYAKLLSTFECEFVFLSNKEGKGMQDVWVDLCFYFMCQCSSSSLHISQHASLFFSGSHLWSANLGWGFIILWTILYKPGVLGLWARMWEDQERRPKCAWYADVLGEHFLTTNA